MRADQQVCESCHMTVQADVVKVRMPGQEREERAFQLCLLCAIEGQRHGGKVVKR